MEIAKTFSAYCYLSYNIYNYIIFIYNIIFIILYKYNIYNNIYNELYITKGLSLFSVFPIVLFVCLHFPLRLPSLSFIVCFNLFRVNMPWIKVVGCWVPFLSSSPLSVSSSFPYCSENELLDSSVDFLQTFSRSTFLCLFPSLSPFPAYCQYVPGSRPQWTLGTFLQSRPDQIISRCICLQ